MSDNQMRTITWEQYSKHTNPQDCWIMVNGIVYNVSDYLVQHPGGDDILVKFSGLDGTQRFNQVNHSPYALSLRNARIVGKIQNQICTEEYKAKLELIKNGKNIQQKHVEKPKVPQLISRKQVALHNKQNDCWVIIQNGVYNLTNYMHEHPGGQSVIMHRAGQQATRFFEQANHSLGAIQKRKQLLIGLTEPLQRHMTKYIIIVILCLIIFTIFADLAGVIQFIDLWDL